MRIHKERETGDDGLNYTDLATKHGKIHALEDILLPKSADRLALAEERERLAILIPRLTERVLDENPNVSWFAGHLLHHLRDQGGREAFENRHGLSIDLFAPGMKGAVLVEEGRLVENKRFHGGSHH